MSDEVPWIWIDDHLWNESKANLIFDYAECDLMQDVHILDPTHPCEQREPCEHIEQIEQDNVLLDMDALMREEINDDDMALVNSLKPNEQNRDNYATTQKPFYHFFLGFRPQCQTHPNQYITKLSCYGARYIRFYGDEIEDYLQCPNTKHRAGTLMYQPLKEPWFTKTAKITYMTGEFPMTCIGIYSMLSVSSYVRHGVIHKTEKVLKNLYVMQWQCNDAMQKQASEHNQNFPLIDVMDSYWLDEDHRSKKENPWFVFPQTSYIDLLTKYENMENAQQFIEDMRAGACVATNHEFADKLSKRALLILKFRKEKRDEFAQTCSKNSTHIIPTQ